MSSTSTPVTHPLPSLPYPFSRISTPLPPLPSSSPPFPSSLFSPRSPLAPPPPSRPRCPARRCAADVGHGAGAGQPGVLLAVRRGGVPAPRRALGRARVLLPGLPHQHPPHLPRAAGGACPTPRARARARTHARTHARTAPHRTRRAAPRKPRVYVRLVWGGSAGFGRRRGTGGGA